MFIALNEVLTRAARSVRHAAFTASTLAKTLSLLSVQIRAGFNSNTLGSNRAPVQANMDRNAEPLLG